MINNQILNTPDYYKKLADYNYFIFSLIIIFIMSYYNYLKPAIPFLPYLKDILCLSVFVILLLSIIANNGKIIRPNFIDILIFFLFIYLLFHFFYTSYVITNKNFSIANFSAAYYGFRITFISILTYFLFRGVNNSKYNYKLDFWIITTLFIGVIATIVEFILNRLNILPLSKFLALINRPDIFNMHYNTGILGDRVIGLAGGPHMTGVYNAIFFSIILFSFNIPYKKFYSQSIAPFQRFKNFQVRKLLLFLSFIAIFISSSKTGWTVALSTLIVYPFSNQKLSIRRIIKTYFFITLFIILLFLFFKKLIDSTYIEYLKIYSFRAGLAIFDVIRESPLIGFGFEVGDYTSLLELSNIRTENITVTAEQFLAQIFRMLGTVGLSFYLLLFILFPLYLLISKKFNNKIKILCVPLFAIGVSFGHYNPFENTTIAICAWYFYSRISSEFSNKQHLLQTTH